MIGVLARPAGQTSSRAIAEWAQLRKWELAHLFALRRKTMPYFSTWSRIYRRDRSMREDDSQLRMGHAPHVLAILNNTALGLFARRGETNLTQAQRTFAY